MFTAYELAKLAFRVNEKVKGMEGFDFEGLEGLVVGSEIVGNGKNQQRMYLVQWNSSDYNEPELVGEREMESLDRSNEPEVQVTVIDPAEKSLKAKHRGMAISLIGELVQAEVVQFHDKPANDLYFNELDYFVGVAEDYLKFAHAMRG